MPIQTMGPRSTLREAWMKMNPIDVSELINVEELEEKSAPAMPVGGRPVLLPETIFWDES